MGVLHNAGALTYGDGTEKPTRGLPWRLRGRVHLPLREMQQVHSLGREDPPEEDMATHSNILAWKISWEEKPSGLQSRGSPRVRYSRAQAEKSLPEPGRMLLLLDVTL